MILVVGDLILDEVIISKSYKNSPEAPVPLLIPSYKNYFLGGAANVANNIKKFGEKVMLVGISDIDKFESSITIQKLLKKNLIRNKIFKSNKFTPPVKKRIFCNGKMIYRIDYEKKNVNDKFENMFSFIKKNIKKFRLLVISDYSKGTLQQRKYKRLVNLFKKNKKITICNPKKKNLSYYDGCDIIVPNEKEFNSFFKKKISLKKKIKIYFNKNKKIKHLIITRGHRNVILSSRGKITNFKVKKVNPTDVTGASDTFISTLSIYLKRNYSLSESINKSIIASRIVIQKRYTSFVKKNEI